MTYRREVRDHASHLDTLDQAPDIEHNHTVGDLQHLFGSLETVVPWVSTLELELGLAQDHAGLPHQPADIGQLHAHPPHHTSASDSI